MVVCFFSYVGGVVEWAIYGPPELCLYGVGFCAVTASCLQWQYGLRIILTNQQGDTVPGCIGRRKVVQMTVFLDLKRTYFRLTCCS